MTGTGHTFDEKLVAETVRFEHASIFNERLVASTFVSPLGICFVGWLQTLAVGNRQALIWCGLIVSIELLVISLGHGFRKAAMQKQPIKSWLKAQLICCGLLGLVLGVATWFVWSPDHFLLYITTLCVLVGISFICMVVMAPMRWAMVPFTVGLAIFPLAQLVLIDNPVGREIAVGWIVMIAAQLRYSFDLRRELVRQIDSSVRNVMLVDRLTEVGHELRQVNAEKEARNAELNAVMEKLNHLVTFDQLTGAFSRRYLMEELDRQVSLRARHGAPVSLIMMDLDHFKQINDSFGHAAGDRALREAALNARNQLRDGDMLGRVGGEEFLILLPMTGADAAVNLAERLRLSLDEQVLMEGTQSFRIPASLGVAELRENEDAGAWYRRADEALYLAKTQGRNRVVAAT